MIRPNLAGHPNQPEWLSHVNASVLKVKLATAIPITFLLSAMAIATTNKLMAGPPSKRVGVPGRH